MGASPAELWLVFRVQNRLCALSLHHVREVMRPLPVQTVAGVPCFVAGLAMIRGVPTAVIDAARLFDRHAAATVEGRLVSLAAGAGHVAIRVDEILGLRRLNPSAVSLPSLLTAAGDDVMSAIAVLDQDLLFILQSTRLLSDDTRAILAAAATS